MVRLLAHFSVIAVFRNDLRERLCIIAMFRSDILDRYQRSLIEICGLP
jgi:hypothetical protein